MKIVPLLTGFICLFFVTIGHSQKPSNDWQLFKNEKGISVFTKKSPNSAICELKTVLTLKTSLSSIVALIYDWESYPSWIYKCGESKTLKVLNEHEVIHYQSVKIPWPANDEDFIIHVKISQDEKTKTVKIHSLNDPDYIPKVENRNRIRELTATWTIIPMGDGIIELSYEFLVNPGGPFPSWLINLAATYGPVETMENLKNWIQKDKYQHAKNNLIKEPGE